MPRKRHKPEEIVAKLRQADVLTSQGQTMADAIPSIGVTEVTYYRWRQEFGGLRSDQVKRLKEGGRNVPAAWLKDDAAFAEKRAELDEAPRTAAGREAGAAADAAGKAGAVMKQLGIGV
jgi:hypothetical protein